MLLPVDKGPGDLCPVPNISEKHNAIGVIYAKRSETLKIWISPGESLNEKEESRREDDKKITYSNQCLVNIAELELISILSRYPPPLVSLISPLLTFDLKQVTSTDYSIQS